MINRRFFATACLLLLLPFGILQAQKAEPFVLVIDAGHGGQDTGTSGHHENEKEIALDVALSFGQRVEKEFGRKVKVVYTRTTDVFIPLSERAAIANRNKADLFVSVHCNAAANRQALGTETFVMGLGRMNENIAVSKRENAVITLEENYEERYQSFDPNDPEAVIMFNLMHTAYQEQSIAFADLVEKSFVRSNRFSRGVKQNIFHVLRETAMPSVLIEIGFISNVEDAAYLNTPAGKEQTAQSIFEAFREYKKEFDRKNGVVDEPVVVVKQQEKDVPNPDVWYKVQFLTSQYNLPKTAPQLKGVANHEVRKEGDVFKYYYGSTDLPSKRDQLLEYIKRKGFTDAFVVEVPKTAKLESGYYTIQILTSNRKYRENSRRFRKLGDVNRQEEGDVYKYYFGKAESNKQAQVLLREAIRKGFSNAFIVEVQE